MKTAVKMCLAVACCAIGIGIVVLIISAFVIKGNGGISRDYNYQMQDTVTGVKSLDIDINYGEVKIQEGDTFSVSVHNMMEDSFHSKVVNGVWNISNELDSRNSISLFGWNIPINIFGNGWNSNYTPKVIITLPQEFIAESMYISIESGSLKAEELYSQRAALQVGAGEMKINRFFTENDSKYQVGAGKLEIREIKADGVEIICGVGGVNITGEITGNNYVNCGVGEIKMNLMGKEEDYSYDVDCGIGEVTVNDRHYGGIGRSEYTRTQSSKHYFELECGIGSIQLLIR